MTEPLWVRTISDHAVVTRDELLSWLQITALELRLLLRDQQFPGPRFTGIHSRTGSTKLTRSARWRAGDVRAWLSGDPARVRRQLATEIGAEQSASTKTVLARHPSLLAGKVKSKRVGEA